LGWLCRDFSIFNVERVPANTRVQLSRVLLNTIRLSP
jgi:hypothetical protein